MACLSSLSYSGLSGTFAWAAPEMLSHARCSKKTDIFSYGVVLWEVSLSWLFDRMSDERVEVTATMARLPRQC